MGAIHFDRKGRLGTKEPLAYDKITMRPGDEIFSGKVLTRHFLERFNQRASFSLSYLRSAYELKFYRIMGLAGDRDKHLLFTDKHTGKFFIIIEDIEGRLVTILTEEVYATQLHAFSIEDHKRVLTNTLIGGSPSLSSSRFRLILKEGDKSYSLASLPWKSFVISNMALEVFSSTNAVVSALLDSDKFRKTIIKNLGASVSQEKQVYLCFKDHEYHLDLKRILNQG